MDVDAFVQRKLAVAKARAQRAAELSRQRSAKIRAGIVMALGTVKPYRHGAAAFVRDRIWRHGPAVFGLRCVPRHETIRRALADLCAHADSAFDAESVSTQATSDLRCGAPLQE